MICIWGIELIVERTDDLTLECKSPNHFVELHYVRLHVKLHSPI